jgi:hypothetical protein
MIAYKGEVLLRIAFIICRASVFVCAAPVPALRDRIVEPNVEEQWMETCMNTIVSKHAALHSV